MGRERDGGGRERGREGEREKKKNEGVEAGSGERV